MSLKKDKIGILGGSFDPAHKGHLAISNEAYKRFKLKNYEIIKGEFFKADAIIFSSIYAVKIFFDEKFKDILNNNYQVIIKEQIFPYMSFNVDTFIAALTKVCQSIQKLMRKEIFRIYIFNGEMQTLQYLKKAMTSCTLF